MLENFTNYYEKARKMQHINFEGNDKGYTEQDVDDPLVWHIPIYDVVNRRFAAFSSLPEALHYKSKDPKGNGKHYEAASVSHYDFLYMCYLFRLAGSGINYIPSSNDDPMGSHGFGNFWIDKLLRKGYYKRKTWVDMMPDSKFADSKGYMLPLIKGGIKSFVQKDSEDLFDFLMIMTEQIGPTDIYKIVHWGNNWLMHEGYNRQNFVLCAFAMDLAEYSPDRVNPNSKVLLGSNAVKCYKDVFPGRKNTFEEHNKALKELCEMTGGISKPMDMEDVMCDYVRYINNYQSPAHVKANSGIIYKNKL